jgi:hypothetical protein
MSRERFLAHLKTLQKLGFNAVPAHPLEKHPAGAWKGLAHPKGRRVTDADIHAGLWVEGTFPDEPLQLFLFPSSHPTHPLVVVDVDDMDYLPTVLEDFGPTPYQVKTRRGVHLYYRADPAAKVTSRNWLYGERSVDIKAWNAGVMAPGARGGLYAPSIPLDQWVLSEVPLFNLEAYEALWLANRPKARAVARTAAAANPEAYLHVEMGEPQLTRSGLEKMGEIAGDTLVTHERTGGAMRIDKVPAGDKVFAFDREDGHASGQVWEGAGQRWYTDHTLGTLWRVVMDSELDWRRAYAPSDPVETQQGGGLDLAAELQAMGLEVIILPSDGYITIPQQDGLTIIKAPHGTGKTVLARTWMDAARSGISVCNTAALAEHNGAKFGIDCYQEEECGPKVSTTINSLVKLDRDQVDFMHIDEADGVHAYLHSGTMDDPVANMQNMLDLAASAKRTLIASADLGAEDISWYVKAYAKRNPEGTVRVFIKPPSPGSRCIRLVPLATAKAAFESAFANRGRNVQPIALGCTARSDVGHLAWGYAGRSSARVFWVSGENSRYRETIERFRGQWTDRLTQTADFLDAADVFIFSPALQSGVSLEAPVARVFMLHTKADFPVESICQMLMRFRNVQDVEVVWGVSDFKRRLVHLDDCYLEQVCAELASETDRQLLEALPEYSEFGFPVNEEFAWSWRIAERRLRRSYADPIGRAKEVIAGHGWTILDEVGADVEPDEASQRFNETRTAAAAIRNAETAAAIVGATVLDEAEADAIDRAHVHDGDDSQKLTRHRIKTFYGLDTVTMEDVRRDAKGRYRVKCRNYASLLFTALGRMGLDEGRALAWTDFQRSKGRQASEYPHIVQKAQMTFDLHQALTDGQPIGHPLDIPTAVIEARAIQFIKDNGAHWGVLFGSRPSKPLAWAAAQMRRCGANVLKSKDRKKKLISFDFSEIHSYSEMYRKRLLEEFKNEKDSETWNKEMTKLRLVTG